MSIRAPSKGMNRSAEKRRFARCPVPVARRRPVNAVVEAIGKVLVCELHVKWINNLHMRFRSKTDFFYRLVMRH